MSDPTNEPDGAAGPGDDRLRAALALYRRNGDTAGLRALYERSGRPRVAVPGLAEDVRAAVVHAYAPRSAPSSDPRWRFEALCTEPPAPVDTATRLGPAVTALALAGLGPRPALPCHRYYDGAVGDFHVIRYQDGREEPDLPGELFVSHLGPFVSGDDRDLRAREALTSAGFRWIDEFTGATVVPGLDVRHFGDWRPLCVDVLLFRWHG
ncbi:hypothetical protein ACFCX4_26195 [Kitasatospora sp. NPDC056327]|uniref:hypothetical protein n=1 Tax=Kitasatospora sp. NPDC056327 TaxID=3345785 RepID=UPI0035E1CBC1